MTREEMRDTTLEETERES